MASPEQVAARFFGAYAEGDLDACRSLLADDLVAFITNADGGVDEVRSRDAYMERVPDGASAGLDVKVTQVAPVDEELAMTMVDIKAERKGKQLHNFAAFLTRARAEEITHIWMVEALPAYSDEFWS